MTRCRCRFWHAVYCKLYVVVTLVMFAVSVHMLLPPPEVMQSKIDGPTDTDMERQTGRSQIMHTMAVGLRSHLARRISLYLAQRNP